MTSLRSETEIIQNWKNDISAPMVSICCLAYNHEKFIHDTLKGFLCQKTNFSFEILIHDDASTDDTAKIIKAYEAQYPKIIKPIYQQENKRSKGYRMNPTFNFPRAKGIYIALCEGDDFWTDPLKLQIQIDFLEQNPEYSMSFHTANRYDEGTKQFVEEHTKIDHDSDFSLTDFIKRNCADTATIVRRNHPIKYPDSFQKIKFGDWLLNLIYASQGKVRYHAQAMATYRIHQGGVWSGNTEIKKNRYTIYMLEEMNKYFSYKYHKEFSKVILKQIYQQIKNYLLLGQKKKARWMVQYAFKNYKFSSLKKLKFFLKLCSLKNNK